MELKAVLSAIDGYRDEMVQTLVEFCRIPALDPGSGGEGELKKTEWLQRKLLLYGFGVERCDAKDDRVPSGIRPNLIVRRGEGKQRLWILSHVDVVPPGNLREWPHDPFDPVVKDGEVYGRGVEDNGQACVASLFALKALKDCMIEPPRPIAVAWVADEETGSYYGAQHIIREGMVKKGDWLICPDWGTAKGAEIEVAEKNIIWLKFTIHGKQEHGSRPDKGINALRAGADLIGRLDKALHQRFGGKDPKFVPPFSTFEPTKKESNVPNVNTIPGEDVFFFDCRILPRYKNSDVLALVRQQMNTVKKAHKVKIDLDIIQNESSPPTSVKSPLVAALGKALRTVRNVEPKVVGIGGGTVAAYFRRAGADSVVWATGDETAHSTKEHIKIDNLVADAKVFAAMILAK
jgi:succinyl-diaminopimelate desuccinylase